MVKNKIELSISKNYVSNWGVWEALREIIQNAQDADKQGHTMEIKQVNDKLIITTNGVNLPISSLVLGNTSKSDDVELVGKYGEGYKLALVVLLREGYNVTIKSGNTIWEPTFSTSDVYDTEVLCINIYENKHSTQSNSQKTVFNIQGLTYSDINELSIKSLAVRQSKGIKLGQVVDSTYGRILTEPEFSGKFYVEGLYIQDDQSFQYGYSFDSEVVSLDRDRKALNYYELLRLTTDSLLNQTEDIKIVRTSLSSTKKDLNYLKDSDYVNVPYDLAKSYAHEFIKEHNIDEDTFVGTEQEVLLSGAEKTHVTNKVEAKIVNKGLDKEYEYQKVKELARDKTNSETAWTYYNESVLKGVHSWLIQNARKLSDKQINKLLDIMDKCEPSRYHLIKQDVEDNFKIEIRKYKPKFTRRPDK